MKLPIAWLREHVQTNLSDEELADALTMAGLEVEDIVDGVFHTKVTPNRGDWLSVVGSAREAAAALDAPFGWRPDPLPDESDDVTKWAGVKIENADLCPRYAAKVVRNVQLGPSPSWMQEKLTQAGMRPVNVIVDITNFVMLELGQPLHAFDYAALPDGQIVVRPARAGEKIQTLDGMARNLTPEMLMICDKNHPVAIAGIMGGADTEVTENTHHLLIESAHFDPGTVRRAAKALGLSTEASQRFERYVDPELVPIALERACDLLAEFAGGEVVLGRMDLYPHPVQARTLTLRPARANAILGTAYSKDTIAHSLCRLGLIVDAAADPLSVIVPTFRPDLVKEIDLIEEVGRMTGYAVLPETLPPTRGDGSDAPEAAFARRVRSALTGLGVSEALTNSLTAPSPFDDPAEADRRVAIRQALSAELSGLRQALVPNLLDALARNLRQRQTDVRLFEIGKVFAVGESGYAETRHVAAVLTGHSAPRGWNETPAPVDFFTAKGIVESLTDALHLSAVTFTREERPRMHPGRCADVSVAGKTIGYIAELDPDAARADLDVPASVGRVAVFELDADALRALVVPPVYHALPRFPTVARDLAVVTDAATPYAQLAAVARASADAVLLESIAPVSVYTGERVEGGKKSVALRLTFRAEGRTLTDSDVDAQMAAVQTALERIGAKRR